MSNTRPTISPPTDDTAPLSASRTEAIPEHGVLGRTGSATTLDKPGPSRSLTRRGIALILISAASFGVMPIFAKLAYGEGVNPKTLLTLRFSLAAIGMWAIWALQYKRGERTRITPSVLTPIIAMGAVGYVGQSYSYFTAVSKIPASFTGLLLYTYPVLVTLLAWVFYREPLTLRKLAALATGAAGTLLVLGIVHQIWGDGGTDALAALSPEGVAWGLSAAIIYSAYIIAGARYTARVNPVFSSAVIVSSAALVYVIWGAFEGELNINITPLGFLWAMLIATICTVVAITTFFAGLKIVGPSRAAILSTIEPTVTVGLATLVLSEAISAEQIIGGALILAAVLILQIGRKT